MDGVDLKELRDEADRLVKLIDADERGLMTWNKMMSDTLRKLSALIKQAKID